MEHARSHWRRRARSLAAFETRREPPSRARSRRCAPASWYRQSVEVERSVAQDGFSVIRSLSGHGVGRTIHEPPNVPNYFDRHQLDVLTEGLVLTVEPLISQRPCRVVEEADGWTLRTHNRTLAAHFEETIVVTNAEPLIITRAAGATSPTGRAHL